MGLQLKVREENEPGYCGDIIFNTSDSCACVCMCAHVHASVGMCVSQRATYRNWFSPSIMWVRGLNSVIRLLSRHLCPLEHLMAQSPVLKETFL